ncbi:LamG-like jellyroll fold domain-containing protein [Proteiniphilum sp. X52]|uniref:LamG-like jellyroll fold domain-containing protein n=1 Tax=Proteiniphilum sp. X52 TaxID=2382159 RepID=UPI0011CE29A8|nr:LamG-like jellyroll fold domain-containing protein [Proteiniphilum sp. X52]
MRKKIYILTLASIFLSCDKYDVPVAQTYDGVTSTRIASDAKHSAFTSLVKFNDYFYCAFREGPAHTGDGGTVRIIRAKDGAKWETVQILKLESASDVARELSFSGNYQNMVIKHHNDFDFTLNDGFSATAYVNLSNIGKNSYIISNRNGGDGFELGYNNSQLFADIAIPYLRVYQTPNNLAYDVWQHVGFVYDGPGKSATLYIDGKAINTGFYASGDYPKEFTTQESTYGNDIVLFSKAPNHKTNPLGYSSYSKGRIIFLRFWDKALNTDEIATDMESAVTANTPNLIAGYDFSIREKSGNDYIIPDIKGKHPGILRNFVKDDFAPPTDLRDPKLSITADNRIMLLVDGELYRSGKVSSRRPHVSFSDSNGENFSELTRSDVYYPAEKTLSEESFWMWSHIYHKGVYFAFDYLHFTLFKSNDMGKTFTPIKRLDYEGIGEKPNETALYIDSDDKMYAFMRRSNKANGYLGTSLPPYTDWTYKELDYRIEGQNVVPFNNDSFIMGTRSFDEDHSNPKMSIYVTDLGGVIKKKIELPSGGDCSYPGLVLDKDFLWISYYSSHEGVTSIYFTKIPIEELR